MSAFHRISTYLWHKLTAKPSIGHSIHSPFVYDLSINVFHNDDQLEVFDKIEKIRKGLLSSNQKVQAMEPGTANPIIGKKISVKDIAICSLVKPFEGRILYKLASYIKPSSILEFGTSLGISTLYLAKAKAETLVVTLEGNEDLAMLARSNFETSECNNIDLLTGEFSSTLSLVLSYKLTKPFLAFIDGNHQYEPVLLYFDMLKQAAGNDSVLIFHDIHWSKEMERAWKTIKNDSQVYGTIDLYWFGLVFFKHELSKEHFKIKI